MEYTKKNNFWLLICNFYVYFVQIKIAVIYKFNWFEVNAAQKQFYFLITFFGNGKFESKIFLE